MGTCNLQQKMKKDEQKCFTFQAFHKNMYTHSSHPLETPYKHPNQAILNKRRDEEQKTEKEEIEEMRR